jgi:hypothetical protein
LITTYADADTSTAVAGTPRLTTRTDRLDGKLSGTRSRKLPLASVLTLVSQRQAPLPSRSCSTTSSPGWAGTVVPVTATPVSVTYDAAGLVTTILRSCAVPIRAGDIAGVP